MRACLVVSQSAVLQVKLSAVAVTPGLARDDFDFLRRSGVRQPPQFLFQNGALGIELICIGRVLVMAAAAMAEVLASRVDALGSGFQHFKRARPDEPRFFPLSRGADAFSRQAKWR